MDITFTKDSLADLQVSLCRAWIETDSCGNYAFTSLLGVNTRRKHGLFVVQPKNIPLPLVLLSHLQDEIFIGKEKCPLYNVEYEQQTAFSGLASLEKFNLDPFPAYYYKCDSARIEKSIFFLKEHCQVIISYKINGKIGADSRLVIRPFFAFRAINELCNREDFENTEVFITDDHQFRYLPYRDAPEVYMTFSQGHFTNSPTWYHNFLYRDEDKRQPRTEDLLTPGFFEFPLTDETQIFISVSLKEMQWEQLAKIYSDERERRTVYLQSDGLKTPETSYIYRKLQNFSIKHDAKYRYFVTDLLDPQLYLSLHCLILLRFYQTGITRSQAQKYHQDLIRMLVGENLTEKLMGLNPVLKVDAATPFLIIFCLHRYHVLFDQGESVSLSVDIALNILNLIRKNRLPFYTLKRNRLLEKQYRKSDMKLKQDYEIFFPVRQNFLLNVFWFNVLQMTVHLAGMKEMRVGRFRRWAKKIKVRFHDQYMKSFLAEPMKAVQTYAFAFHPSMIYSITLPYPILESRESQILYRILIKLFLVNGGINFPLLGTEKRSLFLSPILLGEYLSGWELVMKDKEFLLSFFQATSRNLMDQLKEGFLGYFPNFIGIGGQQTPLPDRASGVATAEAMYFMSRLSEFSKKYKT